MSLQDSHFSQVIETNGAPVGTARIGAELREVRERAGWKLSEVAAELRIREPYLDAIEHGDLQALPGPAYQIGFIRAYAQALGLDGEEILRRFRAEGAGAAKSTELSFLAPVPDRAVPSGAIVLLGVVLLLAGYGFWFLHTESDRSLAASVPAVPAQLAPLAVPLAPPAKPVSAMAQAGQPIKPAPAAIAASGAANPSPNPASTALNAAPQATTVPQPGDASTPPLPDAPGLAPALPTAAGPTAAGALPAGKTILATADSWVEVKDATGNILFSRVMHSGDSWPVPEMPGLTMTSGNAGGTEIADNGAAGPPLGAVGTVLHHYLLTTPANAGEFAPVTSGSGASVLAPATTAPAPRPGASAPAGASNPALGTN